jgi:hypothetical protein
VRGSEFVRRVQALAKAPGAVVRWIAHRGKGMLKQLGLSDKDFE